MALFNVKTSLATFWVTEWAFYFNNWSPCLIHKRSKHALNDFLLICSRLFLSFYHDIWSHWPNVVIKSSPNFDHSSHGNLYLQIYVFKNSQNIWTNFPRNFVANNYWKLPILVILAITFYMTVNTFASVMGHQCSWTSIARLRCLPLQGVIKHSLYLKFLTSKVLNWRNGILSKSHNRFISNSVTRLGDILDFGQLFKAFGNN